MKRHLVRASLALAVLLSTFVTFVEPASAWTGWREIPGGGFAVSGPAAVGNEVFVRGYHNRIYGNSRTSEGWSGWYEVPGNGTTYDSPAAVRFPNGLYLFVRGTDSRVYGNRRDGAGNWSGWHNLGPEDRYYNGRTHSAPSAVYRGDRVWVFIRGTDNRVYSSTRHFDGSWDYWFELNDRDPGYTSSGPAAVQAPDRSDGDSYLFVHGTDDQIYTATEESSPGVWTWSLLQGGGRTLNSPAATSDANGNIGLFVTGTDGFVYSFRGNWSRLSTSRQTNTAPGAAYTSWGLCVYLREFATDRIFYNCN